MDRISETLMVHGHYIGDAEGSEQGWTLDPHKEPLLDSLQGQAFLAAIDIAFGPERIPRMAEESERKKEERARESTVLEKEARERTFIGDLFEESQPLKEVAKAIRRDILEAMVAGVVPPDRYRVTHRSSRYLNEEINIWTWHGLRDERWGAVSAIANRYNFCKGSTYGSGEDRVHFHVRFNHPEPKMYKNASELRKAIDDLTYDQRCDAHTASCEQAKAEAEAWGRAYIAKAKKKEQI